MARGPVPYTCPDIDNIISLAEKAESANESLLSEILGRTGFLEAMRESNDKLRQWGAEQEDKAQELETERDTLAEEVRELKDQVLDLESEIMNLKAQLENSR